MCDTGTECAEGRDAGKYPAMHRIAPAPHTPNSFLPPDINSTRLAGGDRTPNFAYVEYCSPSAFTVV